MSDSDSDIDCMQFVEELVTINKHTFKITKAPLFYAGIGGAIFPGSSYLATYLDNFFSDGSASSNLEDDRQECSADNKDEGEPAYDVVIEIGCGVAALPGLLCCRRNVCNTVVFADLPDVLSQLEANVNLNKAPLDQSSAACSSKKVCPETHCISYDWDNDDRESLAKSIGRTGALTPSLILAADVVYDNAASIMLAKAIGNLYCTDGADVEKSKSRQRVFVGQSSQLPQPWEVFVWELYYVHGLGIKRVFECGPEGQKVPEGVYEISHTIVCEDLEQKYGERGNQTAPEFYPALEV